MPPTLTTLSVDMRGRRGFIGAAVVEAMAANPGLRVVAVVPEIVSFFADSPRRYEVTQLSLVVEER